MRPRVFPAEDDRGATRAARPARRSFNEAAGIPRGRLTGCGAPSHAPTCFNEAAGIPRGRPATSKLETLYNRRFNEAAGIPRGRRRPRCRCPRMGYASMRPRVFPAEDRTARATANRTPPSFNEAAGIPRGRLDKRDRGLREIIGSFNEAAGIPRGRRSATTRRVPAESLASMRPRVFPAEDDAGAGTRASADQCFNEAAGIPRGRRSRRTPSRGRSRRFNEAAGIPRGRRRRRPRRGSGSVRFNEAAGIPRGRRRRNVSSSAARSALQ